MQNFKILCHKRSDKVQGLSRVLEFRILCWMASGCGMDGVGNTGVTWPPNIQLTAWTGQAWDSTMQVKTILTTMQCNAMQKSKMQFKAGNIMWSSDVLYSWCNWRQFCATDWDPHFNAGGWQGGTGSRTGRRPTESCQNIIFDSCIRSTIKVRIKVAISQYISSSDTHHQVISIRTLSTQVYQRI